MKRREFLSGSLSLGGLALSGSALAQSRPCPPQTISVSGGAAVATTCQSSAGQPAWFRDMAPGSWRGVAGGVGQRIRDVLPVPLPSFNGEYQNPIGITDCWNGMAVDDRSAELLMVANGGHRDYFGNETYACALSDDTPHWKRLTDPTASANLRNDTVASDQVPTHADGKPRATHTCGYSVFANGRVWIPFQSGYSGGGYSNYGCTSWDREWARALGADVKPIPNDRSDIAPWRIHTPSRTGAFYLEPTPDCYGYSVYDPKTQNIWTVGTSSYLRYWAYNTASGNFVGRYMQSDFDPGFTLGETVRASGWLAIAPDLRLLFVGTTSPGLICIVSLDKSSPIGKDIGTPGCAILRQTGPANYVTGWAGTLGYGATGAVYSADHRSIFWMEPAITGNRIRQLRIPADPLTKSWENVWSEIAAPGGPQTGPANGIFNKFNLVTFGGEDALVCVTSIDQPVQVYRINS